MKVTSIQTRLLIILLPVFILSLGILSCLSYYLSSGSLEKSIDDTARATSTDYANRIENMIQDRIVRLEDLASVPAIQKGSDKSELVTLMAQAKQRMGMFDVIFFISPDGSGVRSDGSLGKHNDRDYFKRVVETKTAYVSNPLYSKTTGKLAINLTVPVVYNGQLVGILGGSCSLEKLSDIMGSLRFMDSGFGYLADSAGVVIAHPRTELITKLKLSESNIDAELKLPKAELDNRLINLFETTVENGRQVQGRYTYIDGVSHRAVFTPIELPDGMHWVMIVTVAEAEATKEVAILSRTMLVVSVIFITFAILFIFYISKLFAKPIRIIRDECLLLAQGDFRDRPAKINSADEVGQLAQSFRDMKTNLCLLVNKVQGKAEQVAASSEELTSCAEQSAQAANQVAVSITEMAQGTRKQVTGLAQITAVAEKISAGTQQILVVMNETSETAKHASDEATQGKRGLEQVIQQMQQIHQGSEAVHEAISELARGSHEISNIVNLISTIAGQTNLLALNAAIEAAKAGEHGRGFAVVADEVRKLSEESNRAAQQIGRLINHNQANINQAVEAAQVSSAGVKAGVEFVNSTGETFDRIVISITQLSEQIQDVFNAINGIVTGNRKLVTASHELDKVSKGNAMETETVSSATEEQSAAMEEIASASKSLANLAGDLQIAVEKFKV
ncbi:methyl-accepting chemotaxis protein [Pelosinus sp. UFO1]|uniref:methyl-accepting chemotaxis protein n=1 Tax=Pelosinus sp. UFO1 TaxID=484770 RepID=UPI0004D0DF7D|nr:methyl-accepting chemotaxis protein [Pelosinus sp. UFO1]AIF52547.1 methyl-accepting chemotaxis sensory transducer with Cache sensor [Pelosinus sp. UFO1]